jgi:hypothetical protein
MKFTTSPLSHAPVLGIKVKPVVEVVEIIAPSVPPLLAAVITHIGILSNFSPKVMAQEVLEPEKVTDPALS